MADWSKKILDGIDTFHINGNPGQSAVFGSMAEAIIMGKDIHDVILAVAQYKKGRIATFTHDSYGYEIINLNDDKNPNLNLYKNLRKWLTFGKKQDSELKILETDQADEKIDLERLQTYDIIVCHSIDENISSQLIEEYIGSGGAFVHASTPWGFIQLNPDKSIIDFGYLKILHASGITLIEGVAEIGEKRNISTDNRKLKEARLKCQFKDHEDIVKFIENAHLLAKINKKKSYDCCEHDGFVCNVWGCVCESVDQMCRTTGIKSENIFQKLILETWSNIVSMKSDCCKAPGINFFPGDFEELPPLIDKSFHFESDKEEVHVTSCYVPAGEKVMVEVTSIVNSWTLLIGAHTDCLDSVKVNRWPVICKKIDLTKSEEITVTSPFGGCLYLISSDEGNGSINVNIKGVIPCPEFDISKADSLKNWSKRSCQPGLWANLLGRHVIFTFPRDSILTLDDPTHVLDLFDQLIEHYHDLRQSNVNDYRKIWIVADKQPSAGYMHAGYPIVTELDVADCNNENFLLNHESFKKGLFWGIFHEIGHNMQMEEWTFEGTGEVTCNIFTLYGMQKMCGIGPWIHPWLENNKSRAIKYLEKDEPSFDEWKADPGIGLFVFAQLAEYFGWDMFKKLFSTFNSYEPELETEQDKIDRWFFISSNFSGFNLAPLAFFWSIPLSSNVRHEMATLPLFQLPDKDPLLELVPKRVEIVNLNFLE